MAAGGRTLLRDKHAVTGVETLAHLVPRAATLWPDAVGLVGEQDRLSWTSVECRTRRVAARLAACGVNPGDRVAVLRPKSNESFEAVHAVLRAGAVVVPVDPTAPADLARRILAESGATAVVGDARNVEMTDPWSADTPRIDCVIATGESSDGRILEWHEVVTNGRLDDAALPRVRASDSAYLIFTSGTTGRPKGIEHTHRSGLAYAHAAVDAHELGPHDRVAGMSPLHFDMSTLELYAAPLAGACVVTMSEAILGFPASFTERSELERVTVWYTVPFLLRQVVDRGAIDRRDLSSLRSIVYGGEPYPGGALRTLMERLPGIGVTNVYGPAEVNECSYHVVDEARQAADHPIGRPWRAAEFRVVDESGVTVPAGQPGELEVSATTVMRGYWQQPELTARVLRPRHDGPPWYATGDIVVCDEEGVFWFRGRRDHQVKVRGVRIELESVESVLADAPGVAHAVAAPDGPSGDADHLVAAVVARPGSHVDLDALRQWCSEHLSPTAVPRKIVVWPGFPATASGKVDRATVRAELVAAV